MPNVSYTLFSSLKSSCSLWSPTLPGMLAVGTQLRRAVILLSSQPSHSVLLTPVLKRNTAVLAGHGQGRKAVLEISAKAP